MSNNSDDINFDDWGSKPEKKVSDKVSDIPTPKESPKQILKRTTKKMSDIVSDTPSPEIHLEDLMISDSEIWEKIIPKSGALKNWLTINHPKSSECKRSGALSEITLIINEIILQKLKQFQKNNSK